MFYNIATQEWLGFKRVGWSSINVCHQCYARLNSFFDDPRMSTMENLPRRSPENFAEVCTSLVDDHGKTSHWIEIRKFHKFLGYNIAQKPVAAKPTIKLNCWSRLKYQSQCLHAGVIPEILGWNPSMLRWCSLHTVNLGIMLWAGAGCIDILMSKAHFQSHARRTPQPNPLKPKRVP